MPRQPNTFRLQGKSIFLTYPQCPLIISFVIDYLNQLLKEFNPCYTRICQENHQDGEPHLHCLIQTEKKFNIRNQHYFDIKDPSGGNLYHPNCQVPRRDADVADYIAKGGRYEERGVLRASRTSPKRTRDTIWASILNESTSKSDFLNRVQKDQPYVWATQLRNLEYAANSKWPEPVHVYEPRWHNFSNVPPPLQEWAELNLFTVSTHSIRLLHPEINDEDLGWAQEVTQEFIIDEFIGQSDTPVILNDAGPETS
ncbi:repA [Limeum africanum associated virus]|uniref:repA n=1 Tax=Limeum africanum associated virus TaxID=2093276 RepID=UPI000CD374AA|nr:repA [Limeum africanum associated virus]AUT11882.1 repA [Limeum africanum associated virus]